MPLATPEHRLLAMARSTPIATRARKGASRRIALEFARPGDWVEVNGTQGANPRHGEILEVLGAEHHIHFRVRWDEQHESLLYPAPEVGVIVHTTRPTSRP